MHISILLMEQIIELFIMILMGFIIVKADIFVSGSYIFGGNIEERIHKIMDAGEEM